MRILFVNFYESPENLHMEQVFVKLFNSGGFGEIDIVHNFNYHYKYLSPVSNLTGVRVKVKNQTDLNKVLKDKTYDVLIFLDLPWNKQYFVLFLSLFKDIRFKKRVYLSNHLLAVEGQNFVSDRISKSALFSKLNAAFIFEFEDESNYIKLGIKHDIVRLRKYHIDCNYYSPVKANCGNFILSAGSAGRNFEKLFKSVCELSVGLRVFSMLDFEVPSQCKSQVEVFDFNICSLSKFKNHIASSLFVVTPIEDAHLNPTAGMAIVFMSMAMGKPILCRKTMWMQEYIKHGVNGYFYKSLEPNFLRKDILNILSEKHKWHSMGKLARKTMLKDANINDFVKECLKEIARL